MNNEEKINWFWAHRRNASLHHFSFLMHGLTGKGWSPVINFYFDNQIVVGVPEKGCYVFYDKDQLKSGAKYKDVQDSIDSNSNIVIDFRRRTDEIFGAIFFKCINIDLENLSLLSKEDLLKMYEDFDREFLSIPVKTGMKSEKEKFAGALYTLATEALAKDGRAIQAGTSHNLGQGFAKSFNITFQGFQTRRIMLNCNNCAIIVNLCTDD